MQGTYSDGSTRFLTDSANWNVAPAGIATIGNRAASANSGGNRGLVTSVAYGSTNVTATFGVHTATGTLTVASPALVSIAITPASPTITVGTRPLLLGKAAGLGSAPRRFCGSGERRIAGGTGVVL